MSGGLGVTTKMMTGPKFKFYPIKDPLRYHAIKGAYKKVDIHEMIRSLYAQCAIENIDTISESINRTPFQKELQVMFYIRSNGTYSTDDIDAEFRIKETSIGRL